MRKTKMLFWKHIVILGIFFVLLLGVTSFVAADTGTYNLTHQYVDLTIQTDGDVVIQYDIAMSVQSGNIPWVTIGLPSSNYQILTYSGNAISVRNDNNGAWSGVYVSLDRTYYSGESFQFSFKVVQNEFVYKHNDEQASVSFTPCWWDNAVIGDLRVTYQMPPEITGVKTASEPTRYEGSNIIWEWYNVPSGTHESTGVLMPLSAFSHVGSGSGFQFQFLTAWTLPLVIFLFIIVSIILSFLSRVKYEDPQFFSGGFQKLFRHINLECPNDGTRLQKRTFDGTTINFCENCGGSYFDRGEIETLIEKGVNEQQFNSTQISFPQEFTTTGTNVCPRCHGTLHKVIKTSDGKDINIYPCKDCGGIWVNKRVYQIIKDKRIDQDKEQQDKLGLAGDKDIKKNLNKPSWWWFYPYIYYPHQYRQFYPSPIAPVVHHTCACVSCACAGGCACACAGGGAGRVRSKRYDISTDFVSLNKGRKMISLHL